MSQNANGEASRYSIFKSLILTDTTRQRAPKALLPEGKTLRIMANGKVYPSKEWAEFYDIDFANGENGIDIIDSGTWDKLKDMPRAILMSPTPRTEGRIELFGSFRSGVDGAPLSDVYSQGPKSELLLEMVKELGFMNETQKYCDLVVLPDHVIKFQDGICHVPKTVQKGARAGELTYVRRENVEFFPLVPVEYLQEQVTNN